MITLHALLTLFIFGCIPFDTIFTSKRKFLALIGLLNASQKQRQMERTFCTKKKKAGLRAKDVKFEVR